MNGRLTIEPPSPVAVQGWAKATDEHCRIESATEALIRDLQARVHRLELLVRAYGMKLQEQEPSLPSLPSPPSHEIGDGQC